MTTLLFVWGLVGLVLFGSLFAVIGAATRRDPNRVAEPGRYLDRGAAAPLLVWLLAGAALALLLTLALHRSLTLPLPSLIVFAVGVACLVIGYRAGRIDRSRTR